MSLPLEGFHGNLLISSAHRGVMALRQIRAELASDVPDWKIENELAALKKIGKAVIVGHGRGARWSLI